ncbi:MAG TPA: hypothetical protein PKM48_00860 [Parvularculaceae bacterium]|nr:hypothetical protein [Parvularculaceae bacterium]
MTLKAPFIAAATLAIAAGPFSLAAAQEAPIAEPVEAGEAEPAMNEDEMADYLNSLQQIKQDVTLTRSVNGEVVEMTTETVVYSADGPLLGSEAGLSPLEQLKAKFDSQVLTRKEALEEAKLDFIVADLDRNDAMDAAEFGFLVKGWEEAEIAGAGSGRFVEPFFHIDERSAAAEHAELARAKFAEMAGEVGALSQKKYTRKVIEDFKRFDANDDDLLRGEELLNFRAAVRGEPITPIEPEASAVEEPATE